ncbi:hypothetical protein VOM14_17310 [Paraburkholderia sp. MPAMCS5]|uniref:hypothetical protein n=1 Tax=Paraburkholderia sp. MPAMCS5 TaxID=3112563 RepID=UPI002E170207|nr:hypothetical protein [Paraburkholderia sp. MPAMCS5]
MDQQVAESISLRGKREQKLGARENFWGVSSGEAFIKVSLTRCQRGFTAVVQRRVWISWGLWGVGEAIGINGMTWTSWLLRKRPISCETYGPFFSGYAAIYNMPLSGATESEKRAIEFARLFH